MSEGDSGVTSLVIFFSILITGQAIAGVSLKTDEDVLLELKLFLQASNPVNQGRYAQWNRSNTDHCQWDGIACNSLGQVTGVYLNGSIIAGKIFTNFSQLAKLTHLDLSNNTIEGPIPSDLNKCVNLRYLNLSRNLISGELSLNGLTQLQTLDLTLNRLEGDINSNFPSLCTSLVTLNVSMNNFTGEVSGCFQDCPNLKYIDLSSNHFHGEIWIGFENLREISVAENNLNGMISSESFSSKCNLEVLDLSANRFEGLFPNSISNCLKLAVLNLWGNQFHGGIPSGIGSLSNLTSLFLGNNSFDREIPYELLNCRKLAFIDLSRNNYSDEIQPIFGKFSSLKFLLLHSNSYTRGFESSGILKLPNLERLDLSVNDLSGNLPIEISEMPKLKFLVLAHNNFYGNIPPEFGKIATLQALDLSFNNLSGEIPPTVGNLTNLLWLMLANNQLSGTIPSEIGNCRSLLWLNLANNFLNGLIPNKISWIGSNPDPTFALNRQDEFGIPAGSGECLAMKRWIPASYPPFSFTYTLLTRQSCRTTWNKLLKGYGVFPICKNSSSPMQTLAISGYIQLSGNRLSGEIPVEIGRMKKISLIHLDSNELVGNLPPSIGDLPLVVLNVSKNRFFGEIPMEISKIKCLQSLDLSYNNFSGDFTKSLNPMSDLAIFNASYNPLIYGKVPITGQMATFGEDSFVGDPLVEFSAGNRGGSPPETSDRRRRSTGAVAFWMMLGMLVAVIVCLAMGLVVCVSGRVAADADPDNAVKVFRLGETAFTYLDIVKATRDFSSDLEIGWGGYGVVYRGVLPDGRQVAVKKLERCGSEGEREFRAEMEALAGRTGFSWPHPNLVTLYGWCLFGPEKLLVYEYMEGGSLEEVITDWTQFSWEKRVEAAVGVARALVFLHHECEPAVVHRDVKASNVLLDKVGRVRVTDFGLSRTVSPGETHVSTLVAGTVGYIAPEYGHTWRATTKGDVYSFGVLLMELVAGRRAVDDEEECLLDWVRRVGVAGVVESMAGKEARRVIEMWGMMRVAVWCTAEAPHARPDMREVLAMLLSISPKYDSSDGSRSSEGDHLPLL